jgi:hypothetical protein
MGGGKMDYMKYLKAGRIDTAKLALWAALLAVVIVAGMAALGAGHS